MWAYLIFFIGWRIDCILVQQMEPRRRGGSNPGLHDNPKINSNLDVAIFNCASGMCSKDFRLNEGEGLRIELQRFH